MVTVTQSNRSGRRQQGDQLGLPVTIGGVELRSATDFVIFVENQLGWVPRNDEKQPLWKSRAIEVAKLKRKVAEKPNVYTWQNLVLAVEYCRRKKMPVASPAAVCWKVDKALKEIGPEKPVSDVADRIQKAIGWEQARDLPDRDAWVTMLIRAGGDQREAALAEWRAARFG